MTADGWVIFFVAVGAVALAVNAWVLRQARCDREAILQSGRNGILKAAARAAVWREWRRVAGQALLVATGIVGLFATGPPEPYASSSSRIILRSAFVLFQVMLAEAGIADLLARRSVLDADEHDGE